jgi:hypothetical protein
VTILLSANKDDSTAGTGKLVEGQSGKQSEMSMREMHKDRHKVELSRFGGRGAKPFAIESDTALPAVCLRESHIAWAT